MDAFGWSTQYAEEPCLPSRPSDVDGLLSAYMCTSFVHDGALHFSDDHDGLAMSSSLQAIPTLAVHYHEVHDGTSLSDSVPAAAAYMGLDTADMLPSVIGSAVNAGLFDAFAYVPNVAEGPTAPATASNSSTAVFSSYSSTMGGNGGNISSGAESNTCGGGGRDVEVASPCAAAPWPTLLQQVPTLPHSSKRKREKYPASCAPATRATSYELRDCGAKRAAVSSSSSTSIAFGGQQGHQQASGTTTTTLLGSGYEPDAEATLAQQAKEMIYRAAATTRPVHQLVRAAGGRAEPPPHHHQNNKPRRKNVWISSDPQTVAARLRRERVSERLRVLQRLVPGGSRMDTASMLDEAARYLRFLKSQLEALLESGGNPSNGGGGYCNGSGSGLLQNCYTGNNNNPGGGTYRQRL